MNIHFVSLGCDKNLVDSEVMLGIINENGYTITADEESADVIIINTCGFIAEANNEGINTILRMSEYKSRGQCKALIVTGCMAERYREEIFKELPEVDAIVGVSDYFKIADVIKSASAGQRTTELSGLNSGEAYNTKRILSTPGHFAYLKISEGCDNCCTYCTIPSIRGKYRSRTLDSLLDEARTLAEGGVKEIILVAQDTSLYGTDLYGRSVLHELLQRLSKIQGIRWLRLMYCYPEHITDEIIQEMADNPKVCKYIDMPLQHSEDRILKLMGRQSNNRRLREIIAKLREKIPEIAIRTTFIIGFPGETHEEFEQLLEFVKEIKFDRLGVFKYSREEGTPAYGFEGQISDRVKERRRKALMKEQKQISREINETYKGKLLDCFVDGYFPNEELYCGRSFRDSYEVDGTVFFKSREFHTAGDFVKVRIKDAEDYDLIGDEEYEPAQ